MVKLSGPPHIAEGAGVPVGNGVIVGAAVSGGEIVICGFSVGVIPETWSVSKIPRGGHKGVLHQL